MTYHDPAPVAAPGDEAGRLLSRIAAGDQSAFEALYRSTGAMLLAVILRVVRDRDLAEEVLHECFTHVWVGAGGFDASRGSGTAWLVTFARRRAIDCVRSVQAQRDRDAVHGALEQNRTDIEDEVETRIQSDLAATALGALPPEQGRLIALIYYEGLTHRQAAERTGIPLGTVKTRIRQGLRTMREELKGAR